MHERRHIVSAGGAAFCLLIVGKLGGGLILGTAAGWIVGRHDDRAGGKGGAGVTWSNGMHWRRVQSAPLQACGTPFPMVKES